MSCIFFLTFIQLSTLFSRRLSLFRIHLFSTALILPGISDGTLLFGTDLESSFCDLKTKLGQMCRLIRSRWHCVYQHRTCRATSRVQPVYGMLLLEILTLVRTCVMYEYAAQLLHTRSYGVHAECVMRKLRKWRF